MTGPLPWASELLPVLFPVYAILFVCFMAAFCCLTMSLHRNETVDDREFRLEEGLWPWSDKKKAD